MTEKEKLPPALEELTGQLSRFPGVGRKSALRMALFIMKEPREQVIRMAKALVKVKDDIKACGICGNISQEDPCYICADFKRSRDVICVVEQPGDIISIEKSGGYNGLYHVLGGALSPLDGIGPDKLNFAAFMKRIDESVKEIILATNPTTEGDATALYISEALKGRNVKITRIARGIPIGGDLEYADPATIARAMAGRGEM